MSIRDSIGANVKRLREERGLSVIDAAAELGVGRQYWYLIEKGEANMTLEKLELVADILGVSVPELLGHDVSVLGQSRSAKAQRSSLRRST